MTYAVEKASVNNLKSINRYIRPILQQTPTSTLKNDYKRFFPLIFKQNYKQI